MNYQKKCLECGKAFIAKRRSNTLCSYRCKRKRRTDLQAGRIEAEIKKPVRVRCKACGIEFWGNVNALYCSRACRQERGEHVLRACKICGAEVPRGRRVACSPECEREWERRRPVDKVKANNKMRRWRAEKKAAAREAVGLQPEAEPVRPAPVMLRPAPKPNP